MNADFELDFDMFPTPPTRVSLEKTGPYGTNRGDLAVAELDNRRARRPRDTRKSRSKVR